MSVKPEVNIDERKKYKRLAANFIVYSRKARDRFICSKIKALEFFLKLKRIKNKRLINEISHNFDAI